MNEQSRSNPEAVPGSSANGEGTRWRAWPCAACSGGLSAIGFLGRRCAADRAISEVVDNPEQIARRQVNHLLQWVSSCPHSAWHELTFPKRAEGSEHIVFVDEKHAMVLKATRPGIFGDSYYIENDRIHQKNDSPLEYLIRLRLWKRLFLSAPVAKGISTAGQIISRHEFISGTIPTQEEVDRFLVEAGLTPVRQRFWIWKKVERQREIWIGDAREDNFVKTPLGIVPIDLRLWVVGG